MTRYDLDTLGVHARKRAVFEQTVRYGDVTGQRSGIGKSKSGGDTPVA